MATTTHTRQAPDTTAEYGDWIVLGAGDAPRLDVRTLTLTTGDRIRDYYETVDGVLLDHCYRCGTGVGQTPFRWVQDGICFDCAGRGHRGVLADGVAEATRKERRNYLAGLRRAERKAAERAERDARDADTAAAWAKTHPQLLARLVAFDTYRDEVETRYTEPDGDYDDGRFYLDGWDDLDSLSRKAQHQGLTDKQAAYAAALCEQHAAEAAERAAQRYAGEVDEQVTITGAVAVTAPCETRYGFTRLVIVEGTGTDHGVTAKLFSTAKAVLALERGQQVTVTGAVKAHDEYRGVPQTVLARPKLLDVQPAPEPEPTGEQGDNR